MADIAAPSLCSTSVWEASFPSATPPLMKSHRPCTATTSTSSAVLNCSRPGNEINWVLSCRWPFTPLSKIGHIFFFFKKLRNVMYAKNSNFFLNFRSNYNFKLWGKTWNYSFSSKGNFEGKFVSPKKNSTKFFSCNECNFFFMKRMQKMLTRLEQKIYFYSDFSYDSIKRRFWIF